MKYIIVVETAIVPPPLQDSNAPIVEPRQQETILRISKVEDA